MPMDPLKLATLVVCNAVMQLWLKIPLLITVGPTRPSPVHLDRHQADADALLMTDASFSMDRKPKPPSQKPL
jgi:hypothetical protein